MINNLIQKDVINYLIYQGDIFNDCKKDINNGTFLTICLITKKIFKSIQIIIYSKTKKKYLI